MYLVKTKRSPFYLIAYKNAAGKLTSKSTGCKTKADALKFLFEFKTQIDGIPKILNIKLSEFRAEYIKQVENKLTSKYVKSIETSLVLFEQFTGDVYLTEIDFKIAERFINKVYSSSKFAAAAHYRTLKSAFSMAQEWKYISENPFKKFKIPKLPKALPVFISFDQLVLITNNTKSQILKDIFFTGFYTGLRQAELLNLRWNMIDFQNKIITLKQSESFTTKSKRERIIPINNALMEILQKRYQHRFNNKNDSLVFTNGKQIPFNGDWVTKNFKRAVRSAGLDDSIHFHTLRHSFASNLIQSGVSLFVVKELLGHRDFSTTQIYAHIVTKNLSDAVKNLEPELLSKEKVVRNENKNSIMKYDICLN